MWCARFAAQHDPSAPRQLSTRHSFSFCAVPPAPKPVVLPEGDGKPIAEEFCQECHRLTNLTKAHKNLDDWKDTIHT